MNSARIENIPAVEDRFEILEHGLVYADAPIEGFLRDLKTGSIFAFRVTEVIKTSLWHWTLLPADTSHLPVEELFAAARSSDGPWVSILEDRRAESSVVTVATFPGNGPPVP